MMLHRVMSWAIALALRLEEADPLARTLATVALSCLAPVLMVLGGYWLHCQDGTRSSLAIFFEVQLYAVCVFIAVAIGEGTIEVLSQRRKK